MYKNKNFFHIARDCFIETNNPKEFVKIESHIHILERLYSLRQKPFKIVLLYGPPGVGKTMLLKRFVATVADHSLFYYERPFLNKKEFVQSLYRDLHFTPRLSLYDNLQKLSYKPLFIFDETQLFPTEVLEIIRLLTDTKKIRCILSFHQLDRESLVTRQHFQTRIYASLQMSELSKDELKIYIQKKLLRFNLLELAKHIDGRVLKSIHNYTRGNLRETDKFMYTLFDIMAYYYDKGSATYKITKKFVDMAALYLGKFHA